MLMEIPSLTRPSVAMAWRSVHGHRGTESFTTEGVWGMHLYRYSCEVRMNGRPLQILPGMAGFTPPGARMDYRFREPSVHVFAHLAWEPSVLPNVSVPAIFDVGTEFESLWERLERVIGWRTTDPLRAEVRAWDVLLALVRNANQMPETPSANLVNKALTYIDTHLSEGVHASEVADEMGVSRAYLNRRFGEQTGNSITHAILSRRLDRVLHLLRATDLPVKAIASQMGYADVQHLNKHVRGATGKSPRAWR